ncbi:MAG: PEP-CTERM sorting domain-containing protein [Planctomycetota bacterium]
MIALAHSDRVAAATFTGGTLELQADANGQNQMLNQPIIPSLTTQPFESVLAFDSGASALTMGKVDVFENSGLTVDVVSSLAGTFSSSSLAIPSEGSVTATFDVVINNDLFLQYDEINATAGYVPFTQAQNLDDFTIVPNSQFLPGASISLDPGTWRFTTSVSGMTSRLVVPSVDSYDLGGTTRFTFSAVPEPSAPLMMFAISTAMIARRRRRVTHCV